MQRVQIFGFILMVLLLTAGCRGGKSAVGSTAANMALPTASIIASHDKASPKFNTLASRVQVVYEDEKREQSITVSLRMEKDKTIWIKASLLGITLAKAIITPEKVQYYETISNTYFDGDFALLSDWLGTELNYDKTQAILLGQSIFRLDKKNYTSNVSNNKYQLQPKRQPQNFIHSLLLNPGNFKVDSGSLSQPDDNRMLSLRYADYQEISGGFYPSEIMIRSSEGTSNTRIDVKYRKIDLNVSLSFPFSIPEGYEEIKLTR